MKDRYFDPEFISKGRIMNNDELAKLAKSHERPGMTEDKWISICMVGFSLFLALVGWLVC